MSSQQANRSGWWRPVLLLSAVIAMIVLAQVMGWDEQLGVLRDWIKSLGWWGPIAFIGIYIVATVAVVPGTVLTVAAGALFGPVLGAICVSIGATTGATAAFLIARYFARDAVAHWVQRAPRFAQLDEMSRTHGTWVVAITRLLPIVPFNLLNYALGLTRVSLGTYIFWSWLCMLPGTIAYVVAGGAIFQAIRDGRVPSALLGILAAAAVLLVALGYFARRKLKREEARPHAS